MKIFGISVIKNESDIIRYSLETASRWADRIFVVDNGSDDGTWEIVQELARHNPVIVPWKQTHEPFTDGMRADVYNQFKAEARPGDWWCLRLDADEFYIEDPRDFLKSRVARYYHVVCSKHIQYRITNLDDVPHPIPAEELLNKLHYYELKAHSEIRFFKHRRRLTWSKHEELPRFIGLVSPERILIKHYQYRSWRQMEGRIRSRFALKSYPHVKNIDWRSYILEAEDCVQDRGIIQDYIDLPLASNENLNYRWWVFLAKRFLHGTGLWP